MSTPGKTPRSDAARNRGRVLDAALAVIARDGAGASTEQVAAEAGVGVATVFRHFPTKQLLLEAVLERMFDELSAFARARSGDADPGEALFAALRHIIDNAGAKKAIVEALPGGGLGVRRRGWARSLRAELEALLVRAQKAQAVRRDLDVGELMELVAAAGRASDAGREKVIEVIFDGLRR